jgi:hypothetical protein
MLKNNGMTAKAVRKPIRDGYGGHFQLCRQKFKVLDMPNAGHCSVAGD